MSFYLPYAYTSVLIGTGNVNPFGIDPEQTTMFNVNVITTNDFLLESGQPLLLESGATLQLEQASDDPFGIDPELTVSITSGLTSAD